MAIANNECLKVLGICNSKCTSLVNVVVFMIVNEKYSNYQLVLIAPSSILSFENFKQPQQEWTDYG